MKHYFIPGMLLFFGFISCKKNTEIPLIFEENIQIRMTETVDSTGRTLLLRCQTEKLYGCVNFGIDTKYEMKGNKIKVRFNKITGSDGICLTSIGPASTVLKFPGITNGSYDLEFNFGDTIVSGQLIVSTGDFKEIVPVQPRVKFLNSKLGRVPNQTIYGNIHYSSATMAPTIQKFLDSLQYYGASSAVYLPGDYWYFQIDSNGQIDQTQDWGYNYTRNYIYKYSGASEPLKGLVKRTGVHNNLNSLLVSLYTTKGEVIYSWIP